MIPRVQIDFGFKKALGTVGVDGDHATTVVGVDRNTGLDVAFVTSTRDCYASVVRRLINHIDRLRHAGRVQIWSDTESAPCALVSAIVAARVGETTAKTGKTRDAASMGQVEGTVRWWKGETANFALLY
jgi:hypothetical protein